MVPTAVPSRYLVHSKHGGLLHGLRPVPAEEVAAIATRYPGISPPYLGFIAQIGVGSCDAGYIYRPIPVEELVDHDSYKLYRSKPYRSLFSKNQPKPFPLGAIMVADAGASWKYCFAPDLGGTIYTFNLADGSLDRSHASFETLIDEWLAGHSDKAKPDA
jgi:hypothetical protein